MPNQVNLWSYLPKERQRELINLAETIGTETIYIWRRPYYQRRNSLILKKYQELRSSTSKSDQEIYQQIASEVGKMMGPISVKSVEHVITRYSPNT
jgi:hypothetical protein